MVRTAARPFPNGASGKVRRSASQGGRVLRTGGVRRPRGLAVPRRDAWRRFGAEGARGRGEEGSDAPDASGPGSTDVDRRRAELVHLVRSRSCGGLGRSTAQGYGPAQGRFQTTARVIPDRRRLRVSVYFIRIKSGRSRPSAASTRTCGQPCRGVGTRDRGSPRRTAEALDVWMPSSVTARVGASRRGWSGTRRASAVAYAARRATGRLPLSRAIAREGGRRPGKEADPARGTPCPARPVGRRAVEGTAASGGARDRVASATRSRWHLSAVA